MEKLKGTLMVLLAWGLGTIVELLLYKIGTKDHKNRENKTILNNTFDTEAADIVSTVKHYRLTVSITAIGLVVAMIVPFKPIQWLCAIACGMSLPPVFYDVFYNCLPKFRESKLYLCLTVGSGLNLLLMAYSLHFYYWAYIYYKFI